MSVHREKFKPLGGPDGGNGGHGGDVVLYIDPGVHTLLDFHFQRILQAGSGTHGKGSNRDGAAGQSLRVAVPNGTVVYGADGEQIGDLTGAGTELTLAHGGRGGRGNAALVSSKRRVPGFAELGEPGDELEITLELKSVADVGLVGFPSAGKSSLIASVSKARPKIADYPFTTLTPNLGVVSAGETTYTIADVPGLIPGAAKGKGLGLEFLRHIERCAVLAHVIDCASLETDRDPASDIDALEHELREYGGLAEKPRIIVLNKIDIPDGRELAEYVKLDLEKYGWPIYQVSAVSREGLRELTFALAEAVERFRAEQPPLEAARVVIRPAAVDDSGFQVRERTLLMKETWSSSSQGRNRSGGCARRTSRTRRRWATSPTAWRTSGSRSVSPSSAQSPVRWCGSATTSSSGSRPIRPWWRRSVREEPMRA
ncbi:hypothetical protein GCM10029992_25830 [Glycomyces albus]